MFMDNGNEAESEGEGHHERYSRLFKQEFEQDRAGS